MSDDDEYPSAEALAQHERNQHDPAWLEWLDGMDSALRIFFAEDVPDMPADPHTAAGLRHVEQAALKYFRSSGSPEIPRHRLRGDRFKRYIGETYVRNFEGRWEYAVADDGAGCPVVNLGVRYLLPANQLRSALWLNRDGEAWSYVFNNMLEDHADWVKQGRMSPKDWDDFRVERVMRELNAKEPPKSN